MIEIDEANVTIRHDNVKNFFGILNFTVKNIRLYDILLEMKVTYGGDDMAKTKTKGKNAKNISGAVIKALRMEMGLTQAQFGARMELQGIMWDQKTVSSVELRNRSICDYELKVIAQIFNTTTDALLMDETTALEEI